MHFLSIESSTQVFALAVSEDEKVLRARNLKVNRLLENSIIRAIDRILESAGIGFEELDGFVVGLGPGSFTSLRIGLSTVKAFALATRKPVVGVCSLDIIAAGAKDIDCDEICVIVDARRNLLYSRLYRKDAGGVKPRSAPALSGLKDVLDKVKGKTLFVGDGVGICRKDIEQACKQSGGTCRPLFAPEKLWLPRPEHLAKLGYSRLSRTEQDDPVTLLPIYLYAQDCQVSPGKLLLS